MSSPCINQRHSQVSTVTVWQAHSRWRAVRNSPRELSFHPRHTLNVQFLSWHASVRRSSRLRHHCFTYLYVKRAQSFLFVQVKRANESSRTALKRSSSRKKRRERRAPSEEAESARAHSHRSSSQTAALGLTEVHGLKSAACRGGRWTSAQTTTSAWRSLSTSVEICSFSQPVSKLGVIADKYMPLKCS